MGPEHKTPRGVTTVADLYRCSERRAGSECWWWARGSGRCLPTIWTVDYDRGEKRTLRSARAVWNIAYGAGLGGRIAYLSCCNSMCVNPAHVRASAGRQDVGKAQRRTGVLKGTHREQRLANV